MATFTQVFGTDLIHRRLRRRRNRRAGFRSCVQEHRDHGTVLGAGPVRWLVAALLPWVTIGTATQTTLALLPCALVAVGYSLWYYRGFSRREDLKAHGIAAKGVVMAVQEPLMNQVINNVYIKRTLQLRIERSDHVAPYPSPHLDSGAKGRR
jgi:hypothetical protein